MTLLLLAATLVLLGVVLALTAAARGSESAPDGTAPDALVTALGVLRVLLMLPRLRVAATFLGLEFIQTLTRR